MPTPAEVLSGALTRLANDRRRRITQYANVAPRPGAQGVPQRILSDIGFLESTAFAYLNAHPTHVTPPEDEEPRAITQIVMSPYGLSLDAARMQPRRSVVRTARGPGVAGLAPFEAVPSVLVSAELTEDTYSAQKNEVVRRNMTQRHQGPAYHFLVDRRGGLAVGPGLDFTTSVFPELSASAVFIGLEGALGLAREDWTAGRVDAAFELPYTTLQLLTLSVLLAKLLTAYPAIPHTVEDDAPPGTPALLYLPLASLAESGVRNFSNQAWRERPTFGFDYADTDAAPFAAGIDAEGAFDLTTEVFRPPQAPRALAARAEAGAVVGTASYAGEQALYLGAYTSLAAPERAVDMTAQTRRQIFMERGRVTHHEADEAGAQAAQTTKGGASLVPVKPVVTNAEPHVYDYATGLWGDGEVY